MVEKILGIWILVKDYFEIHNYYSKIYGSNTFIMMQVGSFHECYCTDNDGIDFAIFVHKNTIMQKMKIFFWSFF